MEHVFIFRRDIRIHDNVGFINCYREVEKTKGVLYPVFIFTPEQITEKNEYRSLPAIRFMMESLAELSKEIPLTFLYGEPGKVVEIICKSIENCHIWLNEDYTPYSKARDAGIMDTIDKNKGIFHSNEGDPVLHKPGLVKTLSNTPYRVFTPYYNRARGVGVNDPMSIKVDSKLLRKLHHSKIKNYVIELNDKKLKNIIKPVADMDMIKGGRKAGKKILRKIGDGKFDDYGKTRDKLSVETTRLSAYLKFGCLSPREVYHEIKKRSTLEPLVRQLFWRDFYYQVPHGMAGSPNPKYDNVKWENDLDKFQAWCDGKTGVAIVDAGMRQLNTTGFMHNRARLMVASYLLKNLHIDWRWGEKYFAQRLIDYDPLVNNGNWIFIHGSAGWSQPYFRVFKPESQTKKHDPGCEYIKKYAPDSIGAEPIVDYDESKKKGVKLYKDAISKKS